MFRSLTLRPRSLVLLALALIFAAASYGFAASNTVPTSTAGDGSGAVSGYTISNIHYTLNSSNPANIDSVTFNTTPAISTTAPVGTIKVQIAQGAAMTWHNCTVTTSVSCDLTKDSANAATTVTAAGISNLRVVAAQ
jgi:hypothetical protein